MKRCAQCWRQKPLDQFRGKLNPERLVRECLQCRAARLAGTIGAATRRTGLAAPELRVLFFAANRYATGNRKLGGIPNTMSSGETCPDACSFKDNGCFAEFGFVRTHWARAATEGLSWPDFLAEVRRLAKGQLWRHNTAGDLPGVGDALDTDRLLQLAASNLGRRGFTMTRKPLRTREERLAVEVATREGFTVNATAHGLADADAKAAQLEGTGVPLVVVLPEHAPDTLATPAGRKVVVCPAETHGATCADCQLCARPGRSAIVGFRAHGQWKNRVSDLVQLRRKAAA